MSDGRGERRRLSNRRLLARNVVCAVAGQGISILAALVALPVLVHALGTARLGVLLLAWVAIGYASIFDLGLGRALTKMTAECLGAGRRDDVPALFWTTGILTTAVGCLLAVVVAALSPWLAGHVLNIPSDLHDEATISFILLAVSVPVTLTGSACRGYLEALQRFDILMVITAAMSLLSYGAPAVLVQFVPSLPAVVGLLVASRVIAFAVTLAVALRVTPELRGRLEFRRRMLRSLLGYGGWVSLTNVVAATIVTLDRFIVGALLSASAVAFYATPVDAAGKMLIASAALVGVLFPAFALNFRSEPARAAALFGRGIDYTFIALFPMALVLVAFAPEIMRAWLGEEFARQSSFALQWLAAGTLLTGLAQIIFGFVQSDRPDLNAKLVAVELPLFVGALLVVVPRWGVNGAAVVYSVRAVLDAIGLGLLAAMIGPAVRPRLLRQALIAVGGLAVLAAAGQLDSAPEKAGFVAIIIAGCAMAAWKRVLEDSDRAFVRSRLRVGGARS